MLREDGEDIADEEGVRIPRVNISSLNPDLTRLWADGRHMPDAAAGTVRIKKSRLRMT